MEQSFSGFCKIISTFVGHSGKKNTEFHPLAFGSLRRRISKVAYFPQYCV